MSINASLTLFLKGGAFDRQAIGLMFILFFLLIHISFRLQGMEKLRHFPP